MNKQNRGQGARGIEWTDFTWNPIGGCLHGCAWRMPDGEIANCYAEDVANRLAQRAYPRGFEAHYWHPDLLDQPLKLAVPAKIFVGSMADVFGHWVPDEQIRAVLSACGEATQHTFQFLTKNAPRLLKFKFPPNAWIGVSVPPTHFMGKPLSGQQQVAMLHRALDVLGDLDVSVRWMSIEPLSWNVARELAVIRPPFEWAVIGAATNGAAVYQPDPDWIWALLDVLDQADVSVFFKGNLLLTIHGPSIPDSGPTKAGRNE